MRTILAVTSGRADASPMAPVIEALEAREEIEVNTTQLGYTHFLVQDMSDLHHAVGPHIDLVLLLGDRYETLAAALAATVAQIPIAHIHGGETTRGSFDNQIRDAVTKLAHVHFAATSQARHTLVYQLGESRHRIHHVGAPGLDMPTDLPVRWPQYGHANFICTYHPATAVEESIEPLLEALDAFPDYEQIWTGVNNDPGNGDVLAALAGRHVVDFTPREYLLACRQAAAVVGNSSSGIIEAPSLGVPSVDVGRRQEGRERGPSVLSSNMVASEIKHAIECALHYNGTFDNPYGRPGASAKIADVLASIDLTDIRMK